MKKKILLSYMIVCISIFAFGVLSVSAAEKYGDYLYYTVSNDEITITDCSIAASTIEIPATIDGKPVTSIGAHAFSDCTKLTSITIPDSVTSIGDYAFVCCESLTSITIPNNITSIGVRAFQQCRSLTSITIPDSVTSIGDFAFIWCKVLTSINVDINNGYFSSFDGALYSKDKTKLIRYAPGKTIKSFEIPDDVKTIGNGAFSDCSNLTSIIIPYGITSIGAYAFHQCYNLTDITIPDSVTSIGDFAFGYCWSITSITIPNNITSISEYTFFGCKYLNEITLPQSITKIEENAFYGCLNLSAVYYNGKKWMWNVVSIENDNDNLKNAEIKYFWYVTLIDENGEIMSKKKCIQGESVDFSDEEKVGYTMYAYADDAYKNKFDATKAITENTNVYLKYVPNKYKTEFVDEDGTVINEELIDYGAIITPPENPTKAATQQYTYTFAGWDEYYDGITQTNDEMVFTAKYDSTVNQYTYKFLDEDGSVLKEETVDYGTAIVPPAAPTKDSTPKYTYTFVGWNNYTDDMQLTDDIEFSAQYAETINQYTYKFIDGSCKGKYC